MKIILSSLLSFLSFLSLGSTSQALSCTSAEGSQIYISGNRVTGVSGDVAVVNEEGQRANLTRRMYLAGINCEQTETVLFNSADFTLTVVCPGHTSTDYFSASVSCN